MTPQNIQKNAKLQNWSNYNELLLFDVKTIKRTQNYKRDQITINLHRFDIKTIKNVEIRRKNTKWSNYSALHRFDVKTIKTFELRRKTTKVIKLYCIASIWRLNNQNFWVLSQNDESDQIIVHCIDLTSKRSKLLSYVAKLQNDQIIVHCIDLTSKRSKLLSYVAKLQNDQIIVHCIDLTSKRSNLLSYVANLQNDQIIVHCIDLTSKQSKMLRYIAKHSKQRKPTKVIKL